MASRSLPKDLVSEIGVEDLYGFLGVSSASTEKEITRGYRKKALKCHPDKNPDDPNAAAQFQKLYKVYSILTDHAAKAAYDKWLKAKFAAKQRHEELNVKRRKLKESLESKESKYTTHGWVDENDAARKMQKEIERIREEGFHKMKEQEVLLRQQFEATPTIEDEILPTLKITWRAAKGDATNGGYSEDKLNKIFSKYGHVHHILISSKKNGKALLSFEQHTDSLRAIVGAELGLSANPLQTVWVSGNPVNTQPVIPEPVKTAPKQTAASMSSGLYLERDNDYESLTLMRLRQAEERKRLCRELQEQTETS